jgi:hypothetical protein
MHTLLVYFGIPYGAVWSNVGAEPICGLLALAFVFLFRDRIGKKLVRWHHKHHTAHQEELKQKGSADGTRQAEG